MGDAVRTDRSLYVEWYEWTDEIRGAFIAKESFGHQKYPERK